MKKLFPLLFGIFILGSLWWRLIVMRTIPFYDWDESIYAQVAREWMRHPGLALTYNGSLWFEKPPLLFAIIGSLFQVFGTSEFIARVPSLIAGIICLILVYQSTVSITKNTLAGYASVLLCASTPYFIERSIVVNVDVFLALGWLLYASSGAFRARLIGVCVGAYTKSFLGFIPLVADLSLDLYQKKLTARKLFESSLIVLTGLIWHIYMWATYGEQFVNSHIKDHLISRVTKPIELHFGGKYFYIEKLWDNYDWLLPMVLVAVVYWLSCFFRNKTTRLLDLHFAVPLIYFALLTVSKAKLHWYTFPLIPFCSILIIHVVVRLTTQKHLMLVLSIIGALSAVRFIPTFSTIQPSQSLPPQVALARCKSVMPPIERISYLVPPTQRKDAHVIEAAQLNIGSSFIYGSAPTFLFYVDRPVTFYYKADLFLKDLGSYDAMVVHKDDSVLRQKAEQIFAPGVTPVYTCVREDMVMAVRGTRTPSPK